MQAGQQDQATTGQVTCLSDLGRPILQGSAKHAKERQKALEF
jgi:hypothetical protein